MNKEDIEIILGMIRKEKRLLQFMRLDMNGNKRQIRSCEDKEAREALTRVMRAERAFLALVGAPQSRAGKELC